MLQRTFQAVSVAGLCVLLLSSIARAQVGGGAGPVSNRTISATAKVAFDQRPTALRVQVELVAKGKTLKEALAKLRERREAATAQLDTLGADEESITFGNPSLTNALNQQRRQFEMMLVQGMASRAKRVPKGLQIPKMVIVSSELTAEWPLEADGPEGLLLAAEALQEKVKAADLAGAKRAEKLSPEEQEVAEEMAAMLSDSGVEQVEIGVPHFVYIARISDQQREQALAEAFEKAKTRAAQLAKAAGAKLGPLVALSGSGTGQNNYHEEMMYNRFDGYSPYTGGMFLQGPTGLQGSDDEDDGEAIGTDAGLLKFTFEVNATFSFQK